MPDNYWDRYWATRTNRRRVLGAAGALGAGAAGLALVGCGDDDDDDGGGGAEILATPTAGASPTATPVDPFANAKKGGIYKLDTTGDAPTLDPYGNLSFLTKGFAAYVYSRLYKYKAASRGSDARPTPDLAEKAEMSPDGLKWTVTLRKGAKFQNLDPVNGREITTDDVKFSWGRAMDEKNTNRAQLTFIDKVEYTDARTIVFTLKAPNVAFLDVLADANLVWIMPTESGGQFDPAKKPIGSGPWIMDSYQPSVMFKFKKNPDWYETGFPLMDGIELAVVPEYASRLAQFRAGNTDTSGLNASDLVDVKKQLSDVILVGGVRQLMSFLYFDPDPASPWNKDERVRQAVSMCLDRNGLTDLAYEITKLKAAGIDAQGPWNNIIPAGMTRFWLDPQGPGHGDSAKFFKYDPAEAKKLLSAAGFADGIPATYQYVAARYGKDFNDIAEANINFMQQVGFKITTEVQDYNSKYITQTFVGNFKGIAFGYETPFPEAGSYPIRFFTDNPNNHSKVKDATLAKLAADQQKEMDEEKRKQIFFEIQKYHASKMYYVPNQAGAATSWEGHQSWVKNGAEYQTLGYGAATETYPYRWKSK